MKTLFALLLALPAFASSPFDIPQVQCRFVVVSVTDADCKSLNLEDLSKPKMLTPYEAAKLLKKLKSSCRAQMLSAPQMTMDDRQCGNFQIKQATMLITGVTRKADGMLLPKQETVETGIQIDCTPTVSADKQYVRLTYRVERSAIDPGIMPIPVTSFISPVYEGGSQGVPVPFTTYITPAVVLEHAVTDQIAVRDGHTAVVKLSRQPCKTKVDCKVPFLCDLPVIGDAFCFEESTCGFETVFVFMTPCVQPYSAAQPAPLIPQPPRPVDYTSLQSFEFHAPVYDPRPLPPAAPPMLANIPYLSRLFVNPVPVQTCEPLSATYAVPLAIEGIHYPLTEVRPVPPCPVQTAAPVPPCPAPVTFAAPLPPVQYQPAPRRVQVGLGLTQPASGMKPHLEVPQVELVKFASPPPVSLNPEIIKILLEQYETACKAGDTAKALTIAKFCLEMDPACFMKR